MKQFKSDIRVEHIYAFEQRLKDVADVYYTNDADAIDFLIAAPSDSITSFEYYVNGDDINILYVYKNHAGNFMRISIPIENYRTSSNYPDFRIDGLCTKFKIHEKDSLYFIEPMNAEFDGYGGTLYCTIDGVEVEIDSEFYGVLFELPIASNV